MVDSDSSILETIRGMLGGIMTDDPSENPFDSELVVYINGAIMVLRQAGVGPQEGFLISGADETWSDYVGEDFTKLQLVINFIYLSVKMIFDPPANSTTAQSFKEMKDECIWRLRAETGPEKIFEEDS